MATILDVARRAQVSKTTVSRFLNGLGPINVGTAERIRQAILALNYSPSFLARGMRTSRTRTIGMIIPDYSNPFYSELLRSIEAYSRVRGYLIHLANTDASASTEYDCINEMVKRQVDGIVLCSYNRIQRDIDFLVELAGKIPVVVMDPLVKDEPLSYVVADGYGGSKEAVSYLVSTERRRIGYISGPNSLYATHDRFEGYKKGLADSGIPFDRALVYEADFSMRSGYQAARWFFSRGLPVDALMAATDLMAVGAIKFFNGQGIDIPGRIALVGFDNISLCEIIEPSLTTIAQPISDLGRSAATIIIDAIEEKRVEQSQIVMKTSLIVRRSTDAAKSNTLTFDDEPQAKKVLV